MKLAGLKKSLDQKNKEMIPNEVTTTNQPLSYSPHEEELFHYRVSVNYDEEESGAEVKNTIGIVHISRPSIQHVFFLLKPLLNPLLKQMSKTEQEVHELVNVIKLERTFLDRMLAISQNVGYTVDYRGYRYLALLSYQNLTLVVNGVTSITTPGNWTSINFPAGTQIYAQGVSDASPIGVIVRASYFQ